MKGFILGILVTLAKAVDVTNSVVTGVLEKDPWPIGIVDQKQ